MPSVPTARRVWPSGVQARSSKGVAGLLLPLLPLLPGGKRSIRGWCRTQGPNSKRHWACPCNILPLWWPSCSTAILWNQALDFGCRDPDDALQLRLFTGGDTKTP